MWDLHLMEFKLELNSMLSPFWSFLSFIILLRDKALF